VLLAVLKEHRKRQLEERMKLGEKWVDPTLMFTNGRAARSTIPTSRMR
jgi:hypothetical protein